MAGGEHEQDIDIQPDSMAGLAGLLYLGMVSLDGLAYTAPAVPNGGMSTPVLAGASAAVADVLGHLAAALGAAGENVEASMRTIQEADDAATRSLSVLRPI